jgi:threonine/homoserine/homoserine lactone efflux protein
MLRERTELVQHLRMRGSAGAAYLLYLGIGLLRTSHGSLAIGKQAVRPLRKLFLDGAFSNLSNPKVAIFYFAFLPQFVSPSARHPTLSVFVLGVAFAALTFAVKAPVGIFSGALSAWFHTRPSVLTWIYRSSGAILVGLGVRLALERR